ncbi:hypothetical protein SAMN05216252_12663 [Actinacidiphila glaucinigra]|uniref:Uncharacterized protein n=1 Tax=Actinacidiphila glaucinigra TaxID=235986 RepID=A0A239MQS4_9ACTN|nr:hypothetical protein SAMN05216252_12663 [Actinacidiphila glaucinigra]
MICSGQGGRTIRAVRWVKRPRVRLQRAAIPVMHPGRVDVIGARALVLLRIMERTGAREIVVLRARHP